MITTEQWILEVAERSQLARTTCQQLWSNLSSLLIGRLIQGLTTYMRGVGLWSVETEEATIALLPSGERYLMPPRAIPRITNQEQTLSAEEVSNLLTKGAEQIPQTIQSFYKSVIELFEMHERLGHTLEWAPLGNFAPQSIEGGDETSYSFSPSESLLKQINRPFEMFIPTLLKEGVSWSDIEEYSVATIEEAYAPIISSRVVEKATVPEQTSRTPPPTWPPRPQEESVTTPPPLPEKASLKKEVATGEKSSDIIETSPTPPPFTPQKEEASQGFTQELQPKLSQDKHQETSEDTQQESPRRSNRSVWLWVIIPLVILLVALLLWFFIFSGRESHTPPAIAPSSHTTDTIEIIPSDTIAARESVVLPVDSIPQVEILTTVTLEPGDYLARYARRYLGRGEYWIYIYLANEERIQDPDNIPLGTQIEIPTPQSVGITEDEEANLAHAKQLIEEYHDRSNPKKE